MERKLLKQLNIWQTSIENEVKNKQKMQEQDKMQMMKKRSI